MTRVTRLNPVSTTADAALAVRKGELVFNVQDYGIVSDSGATDNLAALNALIDDVPEGSEIFFPPEGNTFYGLSDRVDVNKSITLSGHWHRGTISGALTGSVLGPTSAARHLAMPSLLKISSSRVKLKGLALLGNPTKETAGTVTVNGTSVHCSSLTVSSALVGARVSGPKVVTETTVASVNTGANTVTLSQATKGELIVGAFSDPAVLSLNFKGDHGLSAGGSITLSGFTPSAYNGTWTIAAVVDWQNVQITSAANPGTASVVGTYTAPLTSSELWFGADGIEFDTAVEQTHYCDNEVHVEGFGQGVSFGLCDHITFTGSEITGNYDNICYLDSNQFDFSFIDCLLVGAVRSSHHIGRNASVVNLSCIRTHLGWAEYGIYQDVSSNGNGLNGLTMVASPIEHVSKRHIDIGYGGSMLLDGAGYWTWSDGSPQGPAFAIIQQQNYGDITFMTTLATYTNANCPYLYYAGAQVNESKFRMHTPLGTFASAVFPSNTFVSEAIPGKIQFNGSEAKFSTGTKLGFYGTTPVVKPTITGSRGSNAALADLLTKLAAFGLITDSTS